MPNHHNQDEPETPAEPSAKPATSIQATQPIPREAPTDPAILLFDEADALFNKRSTVGDSHHRYENRKDD